MLTVNNLPDIGHKLECKCNCVVFYANFVRCWSWQLANGWVGNAKSAQIGYANGKGMLFVGVNWPNGVWKLLGKP